MSNSVKFVIKIVILIVYLIAVLFILESHYVAMGECAARVYYYPLGRCDYLLIPLVGIIMLSFSLYFLPASKKLRIIEVFIYASIIIATLLWGNDILASRTIDWPDTYKVSQINVPNRENLALRDTVAYTYTRELISRDNKRKSIITYERVYTFNEDTIYHIKEDFLVTPINVDSLNIIANGEFSRLFYLDNIRQNHVGGYYYSTIVFYQNNILTHHISSYCKDKFQIDSPHGDCEDYFITSHHNGETFFIQDIFINPDDILLKELVADAIIEFRKRNWWKDNSDIDLIKWKKEFLKWDISVSDKAALTDKGVIFSFSYGTNMDICYAENYIHAFVPNHKLIGLIKPNYKMLWE